MQRFTLLSLIIFYCAVCFSADTIETIAGNGVAGDTGDGGPATAANINFLYDVAVDSSNNVYISSNQRVRMISPAGIITSPLDASAGGTHIAVTKTGTVFLSASINLSSPQIWKSASDGTVSVFAGTGTAGYSGDGGPAVNAQLGQTIGGLTTDSSGNLYVIDQANDGTGRIRKIDTQGIISTVAGGSVNVLTDGAQAVSANLNPYCIATDSAGNLIFMNTGTVTALCRITNGTISILGGNGQSLPKDGANVKDCSLIAQGIAVDSSGNIYFTDSEPDGNGGTETHVWQLDSAGLLHAFAGSGVTGYFGDGGPATSASLQDPLGIAVDNNGNVLIVDSSNNRIRRVNSGGGGGGSTHTGSLSTLDSDADGFPDEVETALGTDPHSASSTPFGGSSAGTAQALTISKLGIKLNFAKPGTSDSVTISGTLPVPDQFVVAGQQITIDVGGTIGAFTLNDKGTAALGSNSIKLTLKRKKGVVLAQNAKFSAKFLKAGFADRFTDEGLKNITVKNASDILPFVVIFNQQVFKSELPMLYTATIGKTGHTTQPR